jgi:ribosome assembly protein 1
MMGREFTLLDQVPAGNIVGMFILFISLNKTNRMNSSFIIAIGQLDNLVLKSATLSTNIFCPSFTGLHFETSPIVRVAIEPKNPCKIYFVFYYISFK